MNYDEIINQACNARENSYSPYSNFKVGACILLKDGQYITGANIENAAYGSTMCAERNAIYRTYCSGYHKDDIVCLAIFSDSEQLAAPCGACLQVMSELMNNDVPIVLANQNKYIVYCLKDLLPVQFTGESLNV